MTAHLAESTLILALALAAAHLPRLAARTRYAMVFAALLKFALPSTVVPHAVAARVNEPVLLLTALRPLTVMPAATPRLPLLIVVWAVVATALMIRLALRWRMSVSTALAGSAPADDPALAAAAARIGLRRRVALRRSPAVPAPVTVGIARPVIVIPENLELSAAELESILAHECAHVARHDNALALFEALFGCALWFHPLVWLARRVLARAREEACDERVTAGGDRRTYLDALTRVAAHGVALPTAGVSCAAASAIKERMEAIMKDNPKPMPHRLIIAATIVIIALVMMGSAPAPEVKLYDLKFCVTRDGSRFTFDVSVVDKKSGAAVIDHRRVTTTADTPGEIVSGQGRDELHITLTAHDDGQAEALLRVLRDGDVVETIRLRSTPTEAKSNAISLNLENADVRDVVNTFGKLANLRVVIDDDVRGTVTVNLRDTPWTEALDQILHDAGLRYDLRNSDLHVYR